MDCFLETDSFTIEDLSKLNTPVKEMALTNMIHEGSPNANDITQIVEGN